MSLQEIWGRGQHVRYGGVAGVGRFQGWEGSEGAQGSKWGGQESLVPALTEQLVFM